MKILAVKTSNGYFIKPEEWCGNTLFDGKEAEETFNKEWFLIKNKPKTVEEKVSRPSINYRYELKDISLESDKIKRIFSISDVVANPNSSIYDWYWKDEYSHLSSMYDLKYDKQEPELKKIDFTFDVVCEINNIPYTKMDYKVQHTYSYDGYYSITERGIKHQLIDTIVFPEIVLPALPSALSSKDTYKIVRQYIKENINPSVAEITSDYDFCFAVKKKIPLCKPIKYTVDANNSIFQRKKRKPIYVTRFEKERLLECFEMTNKEDNYKGYTPIEGIRGNNHEELKKNVDRYCKELIEFINTPLKDCPHCSGMGIIEKQETK